MEAVFWKLCPYLQMLHRRRWIFPPWNKGQLQPAVTRPQRLSTPILLAIRVLAAPHNFGLAKQGQKGPSATFCPKGVGSSICSHPIPMSLFVFELQPEEWKISLFHEFRLLHANFFGGLLRSQFSCHRSSPSKGYFFTKSIFPAKWSTFAYSMWYIFGKLMHQRSN